MGELRLTQALPENQTPRNAGLRVATSRKAENCGGTRIIITMTILVMIAIIIIIIIIISSIKGS